MRGKVVEWIEKHNLIARGDVILAACSGGPDSIALVHLLAGLRPMFSFTLAVAHVNHLLRGPDSFSDAEFVAVFCRRMGLDCYQTEIDVRSFAEQNGHSLEEAARILRYQYLQNIAANLDGAKIATGHHRDDQAETVLLNLLRGAGSMGLSGISTGTEDGIIRPFLAVNRQEIEDYCQAYQLQSRLDSTNLSADYLRNRIRLDLLPSLAADYNPAICDVLCRTACIMTEQNDFIQRSAEKLISEGTLHQGSDTVIRVDMIRNAHIALQREIFRMVIKKKQGHLRGISFYHVEKLIEMANGSQVGKIFCLPGGIIARREYQTIDMGWDHVGPEAVNVNFSVELAIPGKTEIRELGIVVLAEKVDAWRQEKKENVAVFDQAELTLPLHIRTRLPGDRFRPLGAPGNKKLKNFFIDHKVPAVIRSLIPLICDQTGILWVGGYRQAERGKVVSSTKQFLQLTIIKTGGIVSC